MIGIQKRDLIFRGFHLFKPLSGEIQNRVICGHLYT